MRLTQLIAVPALLAALAVPQAASAEPPHPANCVATIEGVATPADPGGLVATGVVAVATAQVVCVHDLLDSSVNHLVNEKWRGDITMTIQYQNGVTPPGCSHGPEQPEAVGPLLVMTAVQTCVIPVSDPDHVRTLVAIVDYATVDANHYKCCQQVSTRLVPVGFGSYTP